MSLARNLARLVVDNAGALAAANLTNAPNPILPGTIAYVGMNSTPTGWLKANGAAVSRTTYAALFSAIGTTYGTGDGSTTFNLPDLRGEFPRGFDDGRGVDSGRAIGSAQGDAIRNIVGGFTGNSGSYGEFGGATGAFSNTGNRKQMDTNWASGGLGFDASRVVPTASENRPRNIALLACIKF
jgi:phage-related tail fiber protein